MLNDVIHRGVHLLNGIAHLGCTLLTETLLIQMRIGLFGNIVVHGLQEASYVWRMLSTSIQLAINNSYDRQCGPSRDMIYTYSIAAAQDS